MQEVINRLRGIETNRATLRRGDFEATAHAGGAGETVILEREAIQPIALRNGARYRVTPLARQTYSADSDDSNTETINLNQPLLDSDVTDDVALFEDGTQVSPDSVDYAANTVDYQAGADTTLTVFYTPRAQANLKLKKVAPGGSNSETLIQHDAGIINRRDPNRDPLKVNLPASQLQATVPSDWKLQWTIDGAFSSGWDPDTDPAPTNWLVSLPIARATVDDVAGLDGAVRDDSSRRV